MSLIRGRKPDTSVVGTGNRDLHWRAYTGDKMARIFWLILFLNCAAPGSYRQALRYPAIDLVWDQSFTLDVHGRECTRDTYDLNGDNVPDVALLYLIVEYELGRAEVLRLRIPHIYQWLDKTGEVYAQQFDTNLDGEIESVSGDIHRMNMMIDTLNGD